MTEAIGSNQGRAGYGWVVLAVCTVLITMAYGLMFSYGVFFKPLASHFHWDRAQTSAVYSLSMLLRGVFAILVGWLADRFGAKILLLACGIIVLIAFVSSSLVHSLWQFFMAYGVLLAIGLSGAYGISTSVVAKWFNRRSGLALGIASMGSGFGTLIVVPLSAKLIEAYGWSTTFVIYGVGGGVLMVAAALLIREPNARTDADTPAHKAGNVSLREALRQPELYLISIVMFCFVFCAQVVIVHLVNYATGLGVPISGAAAIISLIGLVSIGGRLITGYWGDKIDVLNLMLIAPMVTMASFIILIFFRSAAAVYPFAVVYAFAYGAEVPLVPMVAKRYFGTKSMAALVGVFLCAGGLGGAAGPLVGGWTFDETHSYRSVFVIGTVLLAIVLVPIGVLKARAKRELRLASAASSGERSGALRTGPRSSQRV